jgi:AraC-like DNA-binding protein
VPDLDRPHGLRAGFHATADATADDPASGLVHAGEQWAPAQFLIEPHTHPVWEIYLQMHGVTRWVAGGTSYLLKPGHLLAVAPQVTHHLAGPVNGGSHHFYFAAIDLAPVMRRQPNLVTGWSTNAEVIHRADADGLTEAFAQLVDELTTRHEYPVEGLTLAVDRIMLAVTRLFAPSNAVPRLAVHPAIRTVKELLDRHYQQRWTLAELADRVGLAPGYLAGLFSAQLGQPPHRYLNERRIERARQLLSSSDLTVTAIAISLGFSSSQHFARTFGQLAGCSPTQYRHAARII